jgi:arylsulfatase A-like enzyme
MRTPNVLLIICDDLGYGDLGCYGNPIVNTPRIDQLAREGARLTRCYSGPLCTPARAALMTGRAAYRTRAIDTYLGRSMIDPAERTMAQVLGDVGYATGLFGKWHLGDCYPMRPMEMGFSQALYHTGGGLEQPANIGRSSYFDPDLMLNGVRTPTRGYCTDIFTDAAIEFIDRNSGTPFFCYVAYNAPHDPLQIGEEWVAPYRGRGLSEETARLYGMVANIDHNVGRLLEAVDRNGLARDTIVLFTSDHGPCGQPRFNAGLRGKKCSMFEGGLRVPAVLRYPGHVPAGVSIDVLTGVFDWMPTFAPACGAALPSDRRIDGINLWPWLTGQRHDPLERELVFQWHRGDAPQARRNAAVITPQYKLVWPQKEPPLLFNLLTDEGEQNDLGAVDHPVAQQLVAVYDRWFADVSSERGPDNYQPPRIVIGSPHEPQTALTWQDWRLYQPRPDEWWKPEMPGYWLVRVDRAGRYRVCADLPPRSEPTVLHLICGNTHLTYPALPRDASLAFDRVMLDPGETRFEVFLGEDSPLLGPLRVLVDGPLNDGEPAQ